MTEVRKLTKEEFERLVSAADIVVPIEQTLAWAKYQQTVEGRSFWGCLALARDGHDVAYVLFIDYETHGYHYLRSVHGPAWVKEPSAEDEQEMLAALKAAFIKPQRK